MPRSWFTITAKSADTAEIDIFDEIGGWGISAKQFVEQLRAAGQFKSITINLDCPGGDCCDGFTIYDAMKASQAEITVNITGMAASMASVIMLAGKKIRIAENGRVMIHRVTGGARGNSDEMDAAARVIKQFEDRIVGLYTARTGKTETEIREMMKAQMGTWFFGKDAVENGFADEIITGAKARAFKNEWTPLFTFLPAALFDTRANTNPQPEPPPTPTDAEMKNLILLLAAAQGITIKADATDAEIETAIKAHKPAPHKFEMNLEDAETKTLFATALKASIDTALPAAVKPLEDKITAQATEITRLTALITNGAAGGAAGGKAIEGAGKKDDDKTITRAEFNALDHAERNAFFRNKGKIAA